MDLSWSAGEWTHPPVATAEHGDDLLVTAVEGSDAWRITSYGFVHDSEHALLTPFPAESAMEVEFTASFSHQFDQAGAFIRVSPERWVKAGVEFADGRPYIGAVVTDERSDWSLSPAPNWADRRILIRVSRTADALIIRARPDDSELQLVRVVPFEASLIASAGPYTCAPTRAGLTVRFHAWRTTEPDPGLH
jgi:uncharacterized protein